jgi:hypothetical protein
MEGSHMSLMKALIPSTILTLMVAAIVGISGSRATALNLESTAVGGWPLYWSWPFFLTVMALNCLLITHTAKRDRT